MRLSHASRLMLVALTRVILAAELRISIPPFPPLLDNPAILPSSTHATLLGADSLQTAHLSSQNTFSFADLAQGSYLLDIHTKDYIFPPFRVDVSSPTAASEPGAGSAQGVDARMSATSIATAGSSDTQQLQQHPGPAILTVHTTFRGNEWSNLGPRIGSSAPGSDRLDVAVHPVAKKQFYVPRAGFSLLAFFKSPMILMGLFTCVVVFGFPKLMENIDPETKAEMEEMQSEMLGGGKSSNTAAQLQNFDLASWMAGKTSSGGNDGDQASKGKR